MRQADRGPARPDGKAPPAPSLPCRPVRPARASGAGGRPGRRGRAARRSLSCLARGRPRRGPGHASRPPSPLRRKRQNCTLWRQHFGCLPGAPRSFAGPWQGEAGRDVGGPASPGASSVPRFLSVPRGEVISPTPRGVRCCLVRIKRLGLCTPCCFPGDAVPRTDSVVITRGRGSEGPRRGLWVMKGLQDLNRGLTSSPSPCRPFGRAQHLGHLQPRDGADRCLTAPGATCVGGAPVPLSGGRGNGVRDRELTSGGRGLLSGEQ